MRAGGRLASEPAGTADGIGVSLDPGLASGGGDDQAAEHTKELRED
jgi:hypothetical protein